MYYQKKIYQLEEVERQSLVNHLTSILVCEDKILFAYLHGSFQEGLPFRDIDIAIYLSDLPRKQQLDLELKLEDVIEQKVKFPVDLKVLNSAPPAFCYLVIKKGRKLLVRDDSNRTDFEVRTLRQYFDFLPFRQRYLKEAVDA